MNSGGSSEEQRAESREQVVKMAMNELLKQARCLFSWRFQTGL